MTRTACGSLQYHVGVPACVLKGDPDVEVDRLIGIPAVMLDRYTQGVIEVLQGKDPKDAYDACEKATDSLAKILPEAREQVDAELVGAGAPGGARTAQSTLSKFW